MTTQARRLPVQRLVPSRRPLTFVAMLVVVLSIAATAQACPACKQALASTEHAQSGDIIGGFMWSILFLMSMPFLLLSAFGTYLWYIVRRARLAAERAQAATAEHVAVVSAGDHHHAAEHAAVDHQVETAVEYQTQPTVEFDQREAEPVEIG